MNESEYESDTTDKIKATKDISVRNPGQINGVETSLKEQNNQSDKKKLKD